MASSCKIPWFILSDGEASTITSVNAALNAISESSIPSNSRVIVLPDGKNFERYIVTAASKEVLIGAIIEHEAKSPQHKEALIKEWAGKSAGDQIAAILEKIEGNKTQYGSRIGKILPVPTALEELFKKIDTEIGSSKPVGKTV